MGTIWRLKVVVYIYYWHGWVVFWTLNGCNNMNMIQDLFEFEYLPSKTYLPPSAIFKNSISVLIYIIYRGLFTFFKTTESFYSITRIWLHFKTLKYFSL